MSNPAKVPPHRIDPTTGSTGDFLRKAASGDVEFETVGVPTEASDLTTVLVPLTAGTELVFDGDDNLILVEVPYP